MNKDASIEIEQIIVGQRRRQKLGNIQSLAKSIEAHGLLHPIVVRNGNELVAGQRRLEACRKLGWKTVPVRHVECLSDEELRAMELDENEQRLALADFESSKQRLAQIRQVAAELKAKAVSIQPVSKPQGGRPKKADSTRAVAEQTGISLPQQRRIETHVSLAEQYPFMQRNGWVQHQVLEAGSELAKLPEDERGQIASMLDQPAIPPATSIEIIRNVAEKTPAERKEIFHLANSDSSHERDTALTKAANVPPPTDPALNRIRLALRELEKAAKVCVTDEFKEELAQLYAQVSDIEERFTHFVRRRNGHAA